MVFSQRDQQLYKGEHNGPSSLSSSIDNMYLFKVEFFMTTPN